MTLFLFSDPDARSRNPESLFFFTQTLLITSVALRLAACCLSLFNIKPPTRGRTLSVDGLLPISGNEEEVKEGLEAEPHPLTSLLVRQISRR
jgi:hypothetical protein